MALPTLPVSYTTVDRIYETLPMIGSVTKITSAQIALQAGNEQARINVCLVERYTLPLNVDVPQLSQIATDMTIYNIVAKRMFTAKRLEDSPWPEVYKESLDRLNDIKNGKSVLVNSADQIIAPRTDEIIMESNTMNYEQTFSELGPLDQIIDPDKVDDLESARGLGLRNSS